jgi:hypothetical protein
MVTRSCDACGIGLSASSLVGKEPIFMMRGNRLAIACSESCAPKALQALSSWPKEPSDSIPKGFGYENGTVASPPSNDVASNGQVLMGVVQASEAPPQEDRRPRGRPKKAKPEVHHVDPMAEVIYDLKRFAEKFPHLNPNDLTKEQVYECNRQMAEERKLLESQKSAAFQEPPSWCASCGEPSTWNSAGKIWQCKNGHSPLVKLPVKEGVPGENLSQLLTDARKLGVELLLTEVAAWSVIKRDVLRGWVQGGGKEELPFEVPRIAAQRNPQAAYEF